MADVGRRDHHAIAIVEAALILEAKMAEGFDRLIVVTCRPEQRIERWARRLKVDQETARREVARRMAAQLSDEEKIKAADYVVDNSGSLDETARQVKKIYAELKKEAVSCRRPPSAAPAVSDLGCSRAVTARQDHFGGGESAAPHLQV